MELHYWKVIDISGLKKRYFVMALLLVLAAAAGSLALRTQRVSVCIIAPDREIHTVTLAKTVEEVLTQVNIKLGLGDLTSPSLKSQIKDGETITVQRAVPVFVRHGGRVQTVLTAERKVSAVLEMGAVSLSSDDITHPKLDEEVPGDNVIKVVRVTYGEVTEGKEVPFDVQKNEDRTLEAGLTRVQRSGTPGLENVTYIVKYEDGVEVSREEKSRTKVKDPSPKILLVGTRTEVSRGGESIRFRRALEVTATAYCPCAICCGPYANGYTHTGMKAQKGVIAVDPSFIPLGSRVYVEGYGYAVAADTGGAIKGLRIDVCYDTHQEALRWGMKKVKVYILPP